MNQLEMDVTLGLLSDPEKNYVHLDPELTSEILNLSQIFAIAKNQKEDIGSANLEMWIELIPWHSLN